MPAKSLKLSLADAELRTHTAINCFCSPNSTY